MWFEEFEEHGASKIYMRTMLKRVWKAGPDAPVPFDPPRKRKKPATPWVNGSKSITQEHVDWMEAFINDALRKGESPCMPEILQKLWAMFQVNIQIWTLKRLLHERGYRYGKLHVVGKINDLDPRTRDDIRKYIVKYDEMLRLEEKGEMVLVYMDESYCNTTTQGSMAGFFVTLKKARNKGGRKSRRSTTKCCGTREAIDMLS